MDDGEKALRVTVAVVVVDVLALPERGLVRKDDDGDAVRELLFEEGFDDSMRRVIKEDSTSRALFVGNELSDPVACNSSGLRVVSIGTGFDWARIGGRTPNVDGNAIASGSSVVSTYIVMARGGGAMRSSRPCLVYCKLALRKSSDGGLLRWLRFKRSEKLDNELVEGRLLLTGSSVRPRPLSASSTSSDAKSPSTPLDI